MKLFEYDSKNDIVIVKREQHTIPLEEFITILDIFLQENRLPYDIVEK